MEGGVQRKCHGRPRMQQGMCTESNKRTSGITMRVVKSTSAMWDYTVTSRWLCQQVLGPVPCRFVRQKKSKRSWSAAALPTVLQT
jgi:hypothetical protein